MTRGGVYMFTLIVCTALFNVTGEHPSLKCHKPSVKDDHFLLEKMIKNDCVQFTKISKRCCVYKFSNVHVNFRGKLIFACYEVVHRSL